MYTTLPWSALCEAVSCLKVDLECCYSVRPENEKPRRPADAALHRRGDTVGVRRHAAALSVGRMCGTLCSMSASRLGDKARLLRLPDMRGLEVLEARFVTYSFDRHTHDTFAIGVIDEGAATLWSQGSTLVAPRGAALVVPPAQVHTGGRYRDAAILSYRMIYPGAEWLAIATGDPRLSTSPPGPRDLVVVDGAVRAELGLLCTSLLGPASTLERQERLVGVLGRLLAGHTADRACVAAPLAARRARDFVHAHATEAISLLSLATLVDLSPSQLIRVFRRSFGFTPHAYQTQRRVEIAKHLLAHGASPVTVAADTGFADQSHLNLHFKRRVAVTPAAYARAHFFQDGHRART